MKKLIIKITAATVFTFTGFTALAQQADRKPKIAEAAPPTEQDKTQSPVPAPQMAADTKIIAVKVQPPAPIVAGGEFKPMDTDKPLASNAKTPAPERTGTPQKPAPVQEVPKKEQ